MTSAHLFSRGGSDQDQHSAFHYVDAVEGAWNSGAEEGGRNLGYIVNGLFQTICRWR